MLCFLVNAKTSLELRESADQEREAVKAVGAEVEDGEAGAGGQLGRQPRQPVVARRQHGQAGEAAQCTRQRSQLVAGHAGDRHSSHCKETQLIFKCHQTETLSSP